MNNNLEKLKTIVLNAKNNQTSLWSWVSALSKMDYFNPAILTQLNNTPLLLQPLVNETTDISQYPNLHAEAEEIVNLVVDLIRSGVNPIVVADTLRGVEN